MNSQKNIRQLSLFDDSQIMVVPKESKGTSKNQANETPEKEGKVISLKDYQYKKAEERFNSYADHLV